MQASHFGFVFHYRSVVAKLGLHNTQTPETTIPVQQAFPHVDYDNSAFTNDIMLLKVGRNVCFYAC